MVIGWLKIQDGSLASSSGDCTGSSLFCSSGISQGDSVINSVVKQKSLEISLFFSSDNLQMILLLNGFVSRFLVVFFRGFFKDFLGDFCNKSINR